MTETSATRIEHYLLGEREVPAGAYWGIHTLRAIENFPITGTPISRYPGLIRALAEIKMAAALIAYSLFNSVNHLLRGCLVPADHCVDGITVNKDWLEACVRNSIGIVTALNPYIGYATASEAHRSGRGVAERKLMSWNPWQESYGPRC